MQIYVIVEGGVVSQVYCSDKSALVTVVDHDNGNVDDDARTQNELYEETIKASVKDKTLSQVY